MRALTGMLYDVEDRAKALTPDERKALRESESRPVVEKIREFLWGEAYEQSLPKNDLRKAMNYVRNNWDALQSFLTDGRLPLDNNNVEQLMKQIAVGRKNWLFIGSVSAGQRAARLMTIVSSALRNNRNRTHPPSRRVRRDGRVGARGDLGDHEERRASG